MTLEVIQRQLGQIALQLANSWQSDQVQLSRQEDEVVVSTQSRYPFQKELERGWNVIQGSQQKEDAATRHYLQDLFGTERFHRLCVRALNQVPNHFTRGDIERLFVYSADITEDDLKELYKKITATAAPILFLSGEEAQRLRDDFRVFSQFDALDTVHIERLINLLCPFKDIDDLFLRNLPEDSFCLDSGKTFAGLKVRVFLQEKLRRDMPSKQLWQQILAKKITNLEMPEGSLLRTYRGGYHVLHRNLHGGGAYKTFFRPLGSNSGDSRRYVLYRGTQALPLATDALATIADDLRKKIGNHGVEATLEETKQLLQNPEAGFIASADDEVVCIGMSLGGAHLSRDVIVHRLTKVVIVSSPGIDDESCELYARELDYRPSITHYIEADDVVDQFGRQKLGSGLSADRAKVRVHILCPDTEVPTLEYVKEKRYFPRDAAGFAVLASLRFVQSLQYSHNRITYLLPRHSVLSFSNTDESQNEELQRILRHEGPFYDKRFEAVRQRIGLN
jgi:hypothetical protein